MNLKECQVNLRVSWYDHKHDKWVCGFVVKVDNPKATVKPEIEGPLLELLIRKLRFAPPYCKAVLILDRHAICELLMDGNKLKVTLDLSGSYDKGFTHPLNIFIKPSDGSDKEPIERGIYLSADAGDLLLGKPT